MSNIGVSFLGARAVYVEDQITVEVLGRFRVYVFACYS